MNYLTRIFSLALSVLIISACGTTAPLTMDMALNQGANFDYAITTTNDMGLSIMGQDMSTSGAAVQDYNFMVAKVQPTGITDVDFKITKMTVDQSVPMMGDMSFDSSKKEDSSSPFAGLGGLIGKTMTASFDRKGQVSSIEGAEVIMKDVMGKMKGGEQVAEMLEGYVGEESFKLMLTNLTGFSQGKPMKVGDSWDRSTNVETAMPLMSEYTYTIRSREKGLVTIDVTGNAKSDPNAKPIETQGMKISYNLAGPITGVIIVDEKTGWATTSDIQQNLDGQLTMGGTPMGDMKVDTKLKIGMSAKRK